MLARLQDTPLSVQECIDVVSGAGRGGLGLFVGLVRNADEGRSVRTLDYQAHPSASAELAAVVAEAAARPGVADAAAVHRTGLLVVGDAAVVVAVSAAHRGPALEATRWLIDTLKERVPIWKHQTYADGEADWVGAG